jgi:LysR family glycine cleavage system transcriptional activator
MTSRHYRLPSLNALATFETTARHRSFKRAADELNVTPGAVSRQIKALEEELGVGLFYRTQTGPTLTAPGELLYGALRDAFSRTADAIQSIRRGQHLRQFTVACTHAFAKCWLMPRLSGFWQNDQDVCVNHLISDDGRDYRRAEVDLRIRYGFGTWPDEVALKLFDDLLYPVVSPSFAERHATAAAADLPQLPLLHVDWVDPDWTGWDELFHRGQIAHSGLTGRRFSSFDVALQACKTGQGVAVGWHRMVDDLVSAGELVPFTTLMVPAPGAYYLTWSTAFTPRDATAAFRDWLLLEAERACRPVPDPN